MCLCCDISLCCLSLLSLCNDGFLWLFLTAPLLPGSSGAGVPTEAAAGAGRSSEENHPAA